MKENSTEDFDSLYVKEDKKKSSGVKIFAIIFSIILLGFTFVYALLAVGAVRDRMKLALTQTEGTTPVSPTLIELMKEKAWIESRVKMAADDSIGLSIDLESHVIQLELKGVVVMTSKIRDYSTSGFFKRMDANVYFNMFGSPLTIQQFESSIAKNPFKVVQAPKSNAEYEAIPLVDPLKQDSLPKENIFWTVKLDREFELNIQGIDSISESKSDYKLGEGFAFKRDLKNIMSSFKEIVRLKNPHYTPEILILIPENEAKAILRALPVKASVTIRI
ncbi:MAG: hypothetical protein H7X84_09960 [Verrucomicrobia bacterium]|nr:hypothetical protein [Prolixibacteraceae bacterium]